METEIFHPPLISPHGHNSESRADLKSGASSKPLTCIQVPKDSEHLPRLCQAISKEQDEKWSSLEHKPELIWDVSTIRKINLLSHSVRP